MPMILIYKNTKPAPTIQAMDSSVYVCVCVCVLGFDKSQAVRIFGDQFFTTGQRARKEGWIVSIFQPVTRNGKRTPDGRCR